ncbi:MAG: hypothetical protein KatS3mg123_0068 [Burkholderiales bacterium]|nr:MAG: hypothetical protein KatS3mg123_0068 [Burkholderiales bacterium]
MEPEREALVGHAGPAGVDRSPGAALGRRARAFAGAVGALALAFCLPGARAAGEERFEVPRPPGWKLSLSLTWPDLRMLEYLPSGQTLEAWQDRLTVQSFPRLRDVSLERYLDSIGQQARRVCDQVQVTGIGSGTLNGYPTADMGLYCTRFVESGQGEITLFRVVQGVEGLYVVQRAWRVTPFSLAAPPLRLEVIAQWAEYLRSITVCHPAVPAHPCP